MVAKSGHAPDSMVEMFFAPPGSSWSATYRVLTTVLTAAQTRTAGKYSAAARQFATNRQARRAAHPFVQSEPVASCHTCQETLHLTNCPERSC